MGNTDKLFLVWAPHSRRSQVLSDALSMPCIYVHHFRFKEPIHAPIKYITQAIRSWQLLRRYRPETVFVYNPPFFAGCVAYLYTKALGHSKFVLDSHTAAFSDMRWRMLTPLHKALARRALINIVTNEHLAHLVTGWGGRTFVLEDKLPFWGDHSRQWPVSKRFNLLVVSSFSTDEPIDRVFEAAKVLKNEVTFYVSGDWRRIKKKLNDIPTNVVLTGFLPDADYIALLHSVDAVVALTERDHTLLCGAYEAVAAGKPLITSNWPVLQQYFHAGTVFVDNTPAEIVRGIKTVIEEKPYLETGMSELHKVLDADWNRKFQSLQTILKDRNCTAA